MTAAAAVLVLTALGLCSGRCASCGPSRSLSAW